MVCPLNQVQVFCHKLVARLQGHIQAETPPASMWSRLPPHKDSDFKVSIYLLPSHPPFFFVLVGPVKTFVLTAQIQDWACGPGSTANR